MSSNRTPNSVSYDALLKVVLSRPTTGKAYEDRLYLAELSNTLQQLSKKIKLKGDQKQDDMLDSDSRQ